MSSTAKLQGLYAFSLPPSLLAHLSPRQLVIPDTHPLHPSQRTPAPSALPPPEEPAPQPATAGAGAYKCALTGASFDSLPELRDHYKTDWYRYNVKLKLKGLPTPVSEDDFNRLVGDLSDSISGSDSDSSASSSASLSSDGDDNLSRLLRRHAVSSSSAAPGAGGDEDDPLSTAGPRTALLWFDTPPDAGAGASGEGEDGAEEQKKVGEDGQPLLTQYGLYRAILPSVGSSKRSAPSEGADALSELRALQLGGGEGEGGDKKERKWTLLMFGGGHFAGMVVSLEPRLVGRGKGKEKEREVQVLQSKTYHRYTTRRKQGGGQGTNDAANGKAKSMGAQLRRHNEQRLTEEVRDLLLSWRSDILESELVFLRCSKSNYKTFFGYEASVLDEVKAQTEGKIRGFTFPTRRPTIAELLRSFLELTRLKTTHLSASALAQLDADYFSSIAPRAAPPPPAPAAKEKEREKKPDLPKLSQAELVERDRWARLLEMVRKGRLDALGAFLDKYGPELESGAEGSSAPWGTLPAWMADERQRTPTLLHVASAADQPSIVRFLLESKRADPTLHSSFPPGTRAAYELAPSRATRNAFRFVAFDHPEWFDWAGEGVGGARVPGGLDERVEKEKEAREAEKRERLRAREAERERARLEAEDQARREKDAQEARERDARAAAKSMQGRAGPQRLGGGGGAVLGARRTEARGGLSEEQRMRVEREERARAAEARLRRLGG
ncbi:hypothetical protein JCM10207_001593 [Rhodosporidiobolus poonsookiae]